MYQAFLDFGLLKCIQRAEEPCWLAGRAATQQKGSWSSSSVSAWINPCINRIHTKLRKEIQPNPSHPTPEIKHGPSCQFVAPMPPTCWSVCRSQIHRTPHRVSQASSRAQSRKPGRAEHPHCCAGMPCTHPRSPGDC